MEDLDSLQAAIGVRVLALRSAKGLSQGELASMSGVGFAGLSRIEAGKQNLTLSTIVRLEQALGARIIVVAERDSG